MSKFIKKPFAPKIISRRLRMTGFDFAKAAYMADIIGLANCATQDSVFNTGIPLCDVAKKKMRAVIFLDSGTTFSGAPVASLAAFIVELKNKTTAARGGRAYPLWDLRNFEDNTGDPSTGSVGNLSTATIVTQDGVPAFRFAYNGTEARHARMSAMNSMSLDVLFVDDAWNIYGTKKDDGVFGGYSVLQAYCYTSKFIVSDAVNQYSFSITLGDITQYRERSTLIAANSSITGALGLINVEMKKISNASNAYTVQLIADGGTNLEPLYGAAIEALTFTATNLQTGASIPITSVVKNDTTDVFVITLDNAAYTALTTGDKVQIAGPSASVLAAANVKPFEILPLVIVK